MTLAAAHIKGLKKADIDVLSKAYGNFDRVVGLGWLLADAVGLPVLERSDAYAVGIKRRLGARRATSKRLKRRRRRS